MRRAKLSSLGVFLALTAFQMGGVNVAWSAEAPITVDLGNFTRAETDTYFQKIAANSGFGQLSHRLQMADIDAQDVVRLNRDTLYSSGVFDLDAGPITVTLPDTGSRFMSMQVISEDHYTNEVVYAPGSHTYTREGIGTRYVMLVVRTFAEPRDPEDIRAANAAQQAIKVEQAQPGVFEIPQWDPQSQEKVRDALAGLAPMLGSRGARMFGSRDAVDPLAHLVGTSIGWGGNPPDAAIYKSIYPSRNDGDTIYKLRVKDVPVDGFWSISVYDATGYFKKNDLNAYSLNNITAQRGSDGYYTVQFGGCEPTTVNCLPIAQGWNYTVRLYRPREELTEGRWTFPEAEAQ